MLMKRSPNFGFWHKAEVRGRYILGPVNAA